MACLSAFNDVCTHTHTCILQFYRRKHCRRTHFFGLGCQLRNAIQKRGIAQNDWRHGCACARLGADSYDTCNAGSNRRALLQAHPKGYFGRGEPDTRSKRRRSYGLFDMRALNHTFRHRQRHVRSAGYWARCALHPLRLPID